jgi:hypothetical protein
MQERNELIQYLKDKDLFKYFKEDVLIDDLLKDLREYNFPRKNYFIPPSGINIVGTCDLVGRPWVKNGLKILKELDSIIFSMYDRNLFPKDKFLRIGLLFLYGIKLDLKPRYDRIDKKYKDLPISMELDTSIMRWADKNDLELMKEIFMIATCEAVLDVLRKYKLPTELIEKVRAQYSTIPMTIEECEECLRKRKMI